MEVYYSNIYNIYMHIYYITEKLNSYVCINICYISIYIFIYAETEKVMGRKGLRFNGVVL